MAVRNLLHLTEALSPSPQGNHIVRWAIICLLATSCCFIFQTIFKRTWQTADTRPFEKHTRSRLPWNRHLHPTAGREDAGQSRLYCAGGGDGALSRVVLIILLNSSSSPHLLLGCTPERLQSWAKVFELKALHVAPEGPYTAPKSKMFVMSLLRVEKVTKVFYATKSLNYRYREATAVHIQLANLWHLPRCADVINYIYIY